LLIVAITQQANMFFDKFASSREYLSAFFAIMIYYVIGDKNSYITVPLAVVLS